MVIGATNASLAAGGEVARSCRPDPPPGCKAEREPEAEGGKGLVECAIAIAKLFDPLRTKSGKSTCGRTNMAAMHTIRMTIVSKVETLRREPVISSRELRLIGLGALQNGISYDASWQQATPAPRSPSRLP
jgi:hypothetical protein